MLKFDLNAIDDFTLFLDGDNIVSQTPNGEAKYAVENWKQAYSEFFLAIAEDLKNRDEWSFMNDFSAFPDFANTANPCVDRFDCDAEGTFDVPSFEADENTPRALLEDFEAIKRRAYADVYRRMPADKKENRKAENSQFYGEIYDLCAYSAMKKIWWQYLEKKMSIEQAKIETASVFAEYRKYRLAMRNLVSYETSVRQFWVRQQDMLKRSTYLYSDLIQNIDRYPNVILIDRLIDIICAQNGETVSGDVLKEKLEQRRILRHTDSNVLASTY